MGKGLDTRARIGNLGFKIQKMKKCSEVHDNNLHDFPTWGQDVVVKVTACSR